MRDAIEEGTKIIPPQIEPESTITYPEHHDTSTSAGTSIGHRKSSVIMAAEEHPRGTQEPNEKHHTHIQPPPEGVGQGSEGNGKATPARDGMQYGIPCLAREPSVPIFAQVLMGLGGSIDILSASFARHLFATRLLRERESIYLQKCKRSLRGILVATVNGASVIVSGVGSEISSTLWWRYVILLPCIAGSIFSNTFYGRFCLGYDRASIRDTPGLSNSNIRHQLENNIARSVFWPRYILTIWKDEMRQ
ncbi:hypothetical protein AC578_10216 [Pseudocercospora eumusae]|uniref:Uncharacterized protein n=1 Tax=Pseudocercospora eumusae TaxID=321146 RepID=A0A139HYJ8_9PEZI|nr:hypothetical protein AC578_10216 [Pseudocercospora eumusae]